MSQRALPNGRPSRSRFRLLLTTALARHTRKRMALSRAVDVEEKKSAIEALACPLAGGTLMSLTPELCTFIQQTARSFKVGALRRRYMAQTLRALGLGNRQAKRRFAWGRD